MHISANAFAVTTGLMAAFACFVVYIRIKNWLDSNVPIIFYIALLIYMKSVDGSVPLLLIAVSFALGLLLRFEFMNPFFIRIVKVLELCTLAAIIYFCLAMIIEF